jgi:hypothetical protein
VKEANKAALIWFARHFGSNMTHENFQNICLENPHYLLGAIYPEASISCLEFAIEFVIWLGVVDALYKKAHWRSWFNSNKRSKA